MERREIDQGLDDDELLHLPSGRSAFEAHLCNADESCVHLDNIEAVYDASNCSNPFATTRHFCVNKQHFTSYANGKSIANLKHPDIRSIGPHMFSGKVLKLPAYVGVVLHYESACFDRWAQKFSGYSQTSSKACDNGSIPFRYYCESLRSFDNDSSVDARRRVWERWKLRPNRETDGIVLVHNI